MRPTRLFAAAAAGLAVFAGGVIAAPTAFAIRILERGTAAPTRSSSVAVGHGIPGWGVGVIVLTVAGLTAVAVSVAVARRRSTRAAEPNGRAFGTRRAIRPAGRGREQRPAKASPSADSLSRS
jgi:hypothetical protein